MPEFNPDSYLKKTASKDAFDPDAYLAKKSPTTPGFESALAGAAQGATFGFADELTGAAKSAVKTAFGDKKLSDLPKTYRDERDKTRAYFDKARQDNPGLYTTGEVGGTIGTAFIPGVAPAKGLSALGAATAGAKIGALQGLGTSEADLTKGQISQTASDVGTGAVVGGVAGGAFNLLGRAAAKATPTEVAKKTTRVLLSTPEEAVERYIQNPEAVKNAKPLNRIADDFAKAVEALKQDTVQGSAASRQTLQKEGTRFSGKEIGDKVQGTIDKLIFRSEGVFDPQDQAAIKYLETLRDTYSGAPSISANRLKDAIQKIDQVTEWEVAPGQFAKLDAGIKKEVRKAFDELLKTSSPAYKESMKDVAKNASLLDIVNQKTANKDTLTNYLKSIGTGKRQFAAEELQAFDQARGTNFFDQVKDSLTKQAFDKAATNGSRNVNFYKTLGEAGESTNIPFGKQAGALTGAVVDKYGPKIAQKAVDTARQIESLKGTAGYQRAVAPILDLARKGDPAAVATFEILQSNQSNSTNAFERRLNTMRGNE